MHELHIPPTGGSAIERPASKLTVMVDMKNIDKDRYLLMLAKALRSAEVEGNSLDDPQGTGWIRISKTLANEIADKLVLLVAP